MSNRHQPSSTCRLLVLAATLLFGGLQSASGQPWDGKIGGARPDRSPNPKTNPLRISGKRLDSRSKPTAGNLPSSLPNTRPDEKQQAIEQAIGLGNQARDDNNYEQALAHYKKAQDLNPLEARGFYGLGNVYSDLYCHDSAIAAYLEALKLKEDYLEALVGLGYAYINKERYDDAWERFQAALKPAPKNIEGNIGLGIVYSKRGKYQEAIEQINQIIKDQSIEAKDRAAAYVALGDVYWKQEKWQETIAQYEMAISLNPKLAKAYISLGAAQMTSAFSKFSSIGLQEVRVQDREKLGAAAKQAADNIQKAMIEHNYSRPDGYLFLSYALMYQARYQEAVSKINTYLAKVKELENRLSSLATKCDYGFSRLNAVGYSFLGSVYLEESTLENNNQRKTELLNEAIEKYKQAIKLKGDYAIAYSELGIIYSQQGKYEEAIEQYKKAILYHTEESNRASYYRSIGLAYFKMGRYEEAIKDLQESIRLRPNDSLTYKVLAATYEGIASKYVGQGNFEETFKWLKKADEVRTTPSTNPDPYFYLGSTYAIRFMQKRDEEDFKEALKWLKKVVEIRPNYAAAYKGLGIVYWKHFNSEEALTNFNEAIKYDAKDADSHLNMARVYSELKHNDEAAIGYLKKAIELKPDFPEAYSQLGLVYHHKKNDAEAVKQILKAIEINPKYMQGYLDLASIYKDQKNYPEAIKYINKAIEIMPDDYRPYKELAKVYEAQQKNEDAIHYYEEAIKNLKAKLPWVQDLYLCRIERLRSHYADAIGCFQKLTTSDDPGQIIYEIGVTHVASKNKRAALEQHQQLVQLKSPLAEELLTKIKEMK